MSNDDGLTEADVRRVSDHVTQAGVSSTEVAASMVRLAELLQDANRA